MTTKGIIRVIAIASVLLLVLTIFLLTPLAVEAYPPPSVIPLFIAFAFALTAAPRRPILPARDPRAPPSTAFLA